MDQRREFAITVCKSRNGSAWQTAAEGHWMPPDQPKLTGEILPDTILNKLTVLDQTVFRDGGTHHLHYGDWYYRFELLKRSLV